MLPVLFSIVILLLSSLFSLLFDDYRHKSIAACGGTAISSLTGLVSTIFLFKNPAENLFFKIPIPNINMALGFDPLSGFFLAVIFGISFLISIYGMGYVRDQKKFLATLPLFPMLIASMAAVTISRDGLSFIISWEIMSLSSYFLVVAEHENKDVQNAGLIYLVTTHLATTFLMVFFILLGKTSGSLLFKDFILHKQLVTPFLTGLLFIFALIGFGTKAGMFPLHFWLPHAHPAAPSYISAIMSGVMIKTGIYGILRSLTFFNQPVQWWGTLTIIIGVVSTVFGVLYAIMQHDLKRLLAYCSVENIGIITIGIGLGITGMVHNNITIAVLGFGGSLFHVLNHAIFKGLLFLCAGGIAHSARTLSIDRLGGLLKKLPVTGMTFLIAALSICGLPPLNGFISEWLIYIGLFQGGFLILLAGIIGIAFSGGLAIACFTKVFGVMFLGEPRKIQLNECHEPSKLFLAPMLILAALCLLIGIFPNIIWPFAVKAVETIYPIHPDLQTQNLVSSLNYISLIFTSAIIVSILLYFLMSRRKTAPTTVTWDCGYEFPNARMQYTSSSFAEPIGAFFRPILNPVTNEPSLNVSFPTNASFDEHVEDLSEKRLFQPAIKEIHDIIMFIRSKKKSTIQYYLILIFMTLITLFVWEVWFGI